MMDKINVTDVIDLKNICRVCLQSSQNIVELFTEKLDSITILETIFKCFKFELHPEIHLPSGLCTDCWEEVKAANNFRLKCSTFNERYSSFNQILQNNQDIKMNNIKLKLEDLEDSHENGSSIAQYSQTSTERPKTDNQLNTNNVTNNFVCGYCGKVLKTKASLLKHILSMHQRREHIGKVTGFGGERKYHCTSCLYSTPHSQTLVNHMRRHNGERPYHCHCGKCFSQSSGLKAHQKTHSETRCFICTECGKQFKHAHTLKRHFVVHDSGKFTCHICYKNLKTKQSLQEHIQRHYNIRNFNCEDCGNTFVTSSELNHHKQIHKLDKKLKCHLCDYKTHEKKSLDIHLKRHAGDKTFKCKLCEVSFYTQAETRRHQRVHTREKPFSCPTCSQLFSYSPSLNKHMMTIHGVQFKWGDIKIFKPKLAKLNTQATHET